MHGNRKQRFDPSAYPVVHFFSVFLQSGNKALHCAAEREESVPVLQVLLQYDVEINICNNVSQKRSYSTVEYC